MTLASTPALGDTVTAGQRLTRAEDDDLRRLHWLSLAGPLSSSRRRYLADLRLRDRRSEIRPPREFMER